jgi:dTDP-4-amino-4,6-dideoxygalactose transaminase
MTHPRRWPWTSTAAKRQVNNLLDAGDLFDFGRGSLTAQLEDLIAKYHGVRYALLTSSGTAALHSAFIALRFGPGDEVIVPSYTFHATATPLFLCGATPVLCDSEPETGNISVTDIAAKITRRTKGIVVTHLFGHPVDLEEIVSIARSRNIPVVEDISHGIGATYNEEKVGTFGTVAAFSMGAAKMVTGGMGGALVTDSREVYERALLLGHCHERATTAGMSGERTRLAETGFGANYRMTNISIAICLDQFRSLDERIKIKTANFNYLSLGLKKTRSLRPPKSKPGCTRGSWYGYKALFQQERLPSVSIVDFVAALQKEGLRVARPTTEPLHRRSAFQTEQLDLPFRDIYLAQQRPLCRDGDFPIAERLYDAAISFPDAYMHEACEDLIDQYIDRILKVENSF